MLRWSRYEGLLLSANRSVLEPGRELESTEDGLDCSVDLDRLAVMRGEEGRGELPGPGLPRVAVVCVGVCALTVPPGRTQQRLHAWVWVVPAGHGVAGECRDCVTGLM